MTALDPQDALALVRRTRAGLASHAAPPRWYAPVYGLGCGAMVAAHALPRPWTWVAVVAAFALVLAIYGWWRRSSGIGVQGFRRGRTLPVTLAFGAVFVAGDVAAIILRYDHGLRWPAVLAGVVVALAGTWASRAWDRVWIAEMRRL